MKKYLYYLLFIFLFSYSSSLFAQQTGNEWLKYNADKKSELTAGLLEFIIPIVGHAYAGNAGKGVIPLVVSVGGIALMVAGASKEETNFLTGDVINRNRNDYWRRCTLLSWKDMGNNFGSRYCG